MSQDGDVKDRRKYQRVHFEASPHTLAVSVEGYGNSVVFDMSYSGAALAQPQEKRIDQTDQPIKINLVTDIDKAAIEAKVIRATKDMVATEFLSVPVEARIIIDRMISDRMIGLNMHLIDPSHYSAHAHFTHWFHGPKETNLFLWARGDDLDKAQFDLNNVSLIFEDDALFYENKETVANAPLLNNQQVIRKALAIITQMRSNVKPLNELKKIIEEQAG
ncbi:MAG: PilZ domain-containing protein [Bdellovibrionales bacterium]|nr:PilZ domain-containing protein [Bdellovibrionales bacterium]